MKNQSALIQRDRKIYPGSSFGKLANPEKVNHSDFLKSHPQSTPYIILIFLKELLTWIHVYSFECSIVNLETPILSLKHITFFKKQKMFLDKHLEIFKNSQNRFPMSFS